MDDPIRRGGRGTLIDILVVPNASRSEVVGLHGGRLKVRVASPPERLKANAAVVALLCEVVGARRGEVVAGRTGRHKTVELIGVEPATVRGRLG